MLTSFCPARHKLRWCRMKDDSPSDMSGVGRIGSRWRAAATDGRNPRKCMGEIIRTKELFFSTERRNYARSTETGRERNRHKDGITGRAHKQYPGRRTAAAHQLLSTGTRRRRGTATHRPPGRVLWKVEVQQPAAAPQTLVAVLHRPWRGRLPASVVPGDPAPSPASSVCLPRQVPCPSSSTVSSAFSHLHLPWSASPASARPAANGYRPRGIPAPCIGASARASGAIHMDHDAVLNLLVQMLLPNFFLSNFLLNRYSKLDQHLS
jgi:hypothetical protein